jgi:hypothetical protein
MVTTTELEEYWEKAFDKPALEIYEETLQLFSRELPEEFWEEYGWEDLLLDLYGELEIAKEHQKLLDLLALLQEKQPRIFNELAPYSDEFLIKYHLYHQNTKALQEPAERYAEDPNKNFDYYLKSLHLLAYYQQEALVERLTAPTTYKALEPTAEEDEDEDLGIELIGIRFYLELQKAYSRYQQNGSFEWESLTARMQAYELDLMPEYVEGLATGFTTPLPEPAALQQLFEKDHKTGLHQLEGYFLQSMHSRGLGILTAGLVWEMLKEFWLLYNLRKDERGKLLFTFAPADFRAFVKFKGVFGFMDMAADVAALLWGTQLVYDFLLACGLVSEKIHEGMLHTLLEEKGLFIADYQTELWTYQFVVHSWPKPNSTEQAAWENEREVFGRSYKITDRYAKPEELLLAELDRQNPLNRAIQKGYRKVMAKNAQLKASMERDLADFSARSAKPAPKLISAEEYAQRPAKVGRNEPCPCGSGKKYKKCCGA